MSKKIVLLVCGLFIIVFGVVVVNAQSNDPDCGNCWHTKTPTATMVKVTLSPTADLGATQTAIASITPWVEPTATKEQPEPTRDVIFIPDVHTGLYRPFPGADE